MNRHVLHMGLLWGVLMHALPATAAGAFSFAVISHPTSAAQGKTALGAAIRKTDTDTLAFVVANGIKAADEPCSDALYGARKALLASAQNGLIVSLAASDWTACKDENGKSAAIGRLSRVRELFFPDQFSFGASRIPIVRQSTTARFRMYVENARWEIGGVMFATIDLPGDNNHYLFEAGRNSEFEDRVIANRNWLHRIFTYAKYQKLDGVVLFSDGNPLSPDPLNRKRRDGFLEIRRQLIALSARFPGKVLIVHRAISSGSPASPGIIWRGRLGMLATASGWTRVTVTAGNPALFKVTGSAPEPAITRKQ